MPNQNSKLSKNYSLYFFIFINIFVFSYFVLAGSKDDIVFPVTELGNCKDEGECRIFCDKPENISACVIFAEKHKLMSEEETKKAKAFLEMGEGPGGCKTKDGCETFCDNPINMNICLDFAEKNNLISDEELKEAKQVAKALSEGAILPGGCRSKIQCENYCDEPSHINECLDFAEKAGFIPVDELREARKAAKAMSQGIRSPGNCRGKKQCEQYCSEPSHMEECLNFAEAAGFIPIEEATEARKIMSLMMRGETPGGCKTKEECEAFCSNPVNQEICFLFFKGTDLVPMEEIKKTEEMMPPREMMSDFQGPGGCKSPQECMNYCQDATHWAECQEFIGGQDAPNRMMPEIQSAPEKQPEVQFLPSLFNLIKDFFKK